MRRQLLLVIGCLIVLPSVGQIDAAMLRQRLRKDEANRYSESVKKFYQGSLYEPVWFSSSGSGNRKQLSQLLFEAAKKGIEDRQQSYGYVRRSDEIHPATASSEDSLLAELSFTQVLIDYLHALSGTLDQPEFRYQGLQRKISYEVDSVAGEYARQNKLQALVDSLNPALKEIATLEKKLELLQARQSGLSSTERKISNTTVTYKNIALAEKLYLLGIIDTLQPISDQAMKQFVRQAQIEFNLLNDGVLRSTILDELNVSVKERIRRLVISLNDYRWLHSICQSEPVIVVNIPAATLCIYRKDSVTLRMRMIVGKPSTPTPTLTSRVSEVIFYPYWNVPHNIAVNEMLPSIKENIRYIDASNLQIMDQSGRILEPGKINWKALNASDFPYRIRQSTGCDNALGIVKVNFYNPFAVYLHDTPVKSLFMLNKRYFSHGCMRMEQPMDVVKILLDNRWPAGLDTTVCLEEQQPVTVPAAVLMPVVVWYNPVGIDDKGRIIFYEDIYRKLGK